MKRIIAILGALLAASCSMDSNRAESDLPSAVRYPLEAGATYAQRGEPGAPADESAIAPLETRATTLATTVAGLQTEIGSLDTMLGGIDTTIADLETRAAALETAGLRSCPSGMVAVGSFCIDKYEASVRSNADCTGTPYGETSTDDYPPEFPDNGNFTIPLYACSIPAVMPARMLTWFQAQQACVASGKRLCTNEEWQAAAAGTYDPGAWPGGTCASTSPAPGRCLTCANTSRNSGQAGTVAGGVNDCISRFGAEDMIGNVWEWVAWWGQAGRTWQTADGQSAAPWPAGYNGDGTWNLNGTAHNGLLWAAGMPAAALRGGDWQFGTGTGAFAVFISYGPIFWGSSLGFRCCRER